MGRNGWEHTSPAYEDKDEMVEDLHESRSDYGVHKKGEGQNRDGESYNNKWGADEEELNYSEDRRDSEGHRGENHGYEDEGQQSGGRKEWSDSASQDRDRYNGKEVIREETEEEQSKGNANDEELRAKKSRQASRGRAGGHKRSRSQTKGVFGEHGDIESGEESPSVSQENYEHKSDRSKARDAKNPIKETKEKRTTLAEHTDSSRESSATRIRRKEPIKVKVAEQNLRRIRPIIKSSMKGEYLALISRMRNPSPHLRLASRSLSAANRLLSWKQGQATEAKT
jgi:hypothetical protein